jgi:hypothetical protein
MPQKRKVEPVNDNSIAKRLIEIGLCASLWSR